MVTCSRLASCRIGTRREVLGGQALCDASPDSRRRRVTRAAGNGDDSSGAGVTILNQTGGGSGTRPWRGRGDDTLLLFARAVQQLHTYPPASPLCRQAIDAWHRLLSASAQREPLDFRVAPSELTIDDVAVGRGTLIESELARRLHATGIAQVTIERDASPRELTHLCLDLLSCSDRRPRTPESGRAARGAWCVADRRAGRLPAGSAARRSALATARRTGGRAARPA